MTKLKSINPHNQKLVGQLTISSKKDIEKSFNNAKIAQPSWASRPIKERAKYLVKLASLLNKNKKEIATLVSNEMGKPFSQSVDDVDWEIGYLKWYATEGVKALQTEHLGTKKGVIYENVYEPWGGGCCNFPLEFSNIDGQFRRLTCITSWKYCSI